MPDSYLITGGAGFIGTNVAAHYLSQGKHVTILDNLSRHGARDNLHWLRETFGSGLKAVNGDVRRNTPRLLKLVDEADVVIHLAAQVAVTTSVTNPREDFDINARGTFNILEAVRLSSSQPIVIFSSTNKVYGKMAEIAISERAGRYEYEQLADGVAETQPIDLYSPYGCSKGAGDLYMLDYARIYGLKTVVFRQSCIYGPHQFGIEDQGWVAWFAIRALLDMPVTIYGDGKQVRDVLYIDDLIAAFDGAVACISRTSGQAYNIGGGPDNTLSLLELIDNLDEQLSRSMQFSFADWRPGDQLVYISNLKKAQTDFGWQPRVRPAAGLEMLVGWLRQNLHLFEGMDTMAFLPHISGTKRSRRKAVKINQRGVSPLAPQLTPAIG